MKKLLLFAVALILFACSKEDSTPKVTLQEGVDNDPQVVYASLEGNSNTGTKVYIDDQIRLRWNADDRISFFNKKTRNREYRFTGTDGANGGEFEKVPTENPGTGNSIPNIYSVYPYSSSTTISDMSEENYKLTLTLPTEQTYRAGMYGYGANTMVSVTSDIDDDLYFKNVCGYLRFRFYGDNISITSIKLEGNNGEKIAGQAYVEATVSGNPSVTMGESATSSITLEAPRDETGVFVPVPIGTSSSDYTEFLFVVPPTTFSGGIKVTVTDALGGVYERVVTTQSFTINRSAMKSVPAIKVTPNYDDVYVEFDDENFYWFCLLDAGYDTNGDEKISVSEAKAATSMDMSSFSTPIESLTGLEYFTNLVSLDCSNHDFETINLSTLSKLESFKCWYGNFSELDLSANTSLKTLNLAGCLGLLSLDLSGNPNLTYVRCQGGVSSVTGEPLGHLSSLNVSNNPALTYLRVDQNALTSLDVSNCSALVNLLCGENQLSSLDISANSALEQLSCNANNLTSLVTGANPVLRIIGCEKNPFTELEIKGKPALAAVNANNCTSLRKLVLKNNALISVNVLGCGALKELDLDNNQLESVNLCDNINLESFFCDNNKLTSIDFGNNVALVGVRVSDNELTSLDISNNPALEVVQFWGNKLTSWSGSANNTVLNTVRCDNNLLTSLDVSMLPALKLLYCDGNQLSSIDVSSNAKLTLLYCNDNNLTALNLSGNALLTDLICSNNSLTALDLSNNTKISDVRFSNNSISSIDMSFLTKLWLVECYGNNITTLDVSSSAGLTYLYAWPQQSTLTTVRKKTSANITYILAEGETWPSINPADYGTTVVNVD